MESRRKDPKGYFFNTISLKYDLIVSAYNRRNERVCIERANELSEYIKEYAPFYGITAPEVKQYFVTNKMAMNFKF